MGHSAIFSWSAPPVQGKGHLPQNTSLQLSGVRPFSIVPACLDGTTWFSMRVSINHFIGPIDFDSLLFRP